MKFLYPIKKLNLKPWIKYWLLKKTSGESTLKAITISTGTLKKVDKSKALSIKEYYGNIVQNGNPSPQAPVEIQTITGENTFTINSNTYRIDLGGTNLFNINATPSRVGGSTTYSLNNGILNVSGNWFIGYQVNVKPNTDYYISAEREIISGTASGNISIYNSTITTVIKNGGRSNFTFNSENNTVVSIVLYAGNGSAGEANFSNIMLNIGTNEKPYSPYVSNPIELCKIGNYQDKLYYDSGKWYLHKEVGKVILNGTETWKRTQVSASSSYAFWNQYTNLNIPVGKYGQKYCDRFEYQEKKWEESTPNHLVENNTYTSDLSILFNVDSTIATTVADWKTWLSTHNTTVYYVLATPTTEEITNTNLILQLNVLYEFYVNSSTVNISNSSEIPFEFLLEYYGR